MKKFLVGFLAILLVAQTCRVISQTLAPVDSGFSWGPIMFIGLVGLVIAGLVLWHKRNPSKADAAIQSALAGAKDDAHELARKAVEAVQTLVKTNREQSMVLASPPVQAAINGGPPLQTAQTQSAPAQIEPQSTIAPAPIPTPQPQPAAPAAPVPAASPQTAGGPMDVVINPADYPAIDPATGTLIDASLQATPEGKLAINIAARQYGIALMTDYQLRQAALYDSQRNNLLARNLIKQDASMANNPAVIRMMKSPEQVYYALLKKKALAG